MTVSLSCSDQRYPHAAFAWKGADQSEYVTVVFKVTYQLQPGTSQIAEAQLPLISIDQHWGNDASRSVYAPSDLVPKKRAAEVVLVGSAYAPGGVATTSLEARLTVGDWSKSVTVSGDRMVRSDGQRTQKQGFKSMPLVYERAAGGAESWNPVGVPPLPAAPSGTTSLPTGPAPNVAIGGSGVPGFGPISVSWPGRRAALGPGTAPFALDEVLQNGLSRGVSERFFLCAPEDQQFARLERDVSLELLNLHPSHPILKTILPGFRAVANEVRRGTSQLTELVPDLVWIMTDRATATVTYRGTLLVFRGDTQVYLELAPADDLPFASGPQDESQAAHRPSEKVGAFEALVSPPRVSSPRELPRQQTVTVVGPVGGETLPIGPAVQVPKAAASVSAQPVSPPAMAQPARVDAEPRAIQTPSAFTSASTPPPALSASAVAPPAVVVPLARPVGVVEASNLAADPQASGSVALALKKPRHSSGLVLAWFEPSWAPALRREPEWRKILRKMEEREEAPGEDAESTASVEDRRDCGEIVRQARPRSLESLDRILRDWIGSSGGSGHPPLALVAGELGFVFEPIKVLKTWVSAARGLASADPSLKPAYDEASTFLQGADAFTSEEEILVAVSSLRDAVSGRTRKGIVSPVDERVDQTLARLRAYQEVRVGGRSLVKVLVRESSEGTPAVGYLPSEAAEQLPLVSRLNARLIAEVVPSEESEQGPAALRIRVIARRLSMS